MTDARPRYLSQSELARRFGVTNTAVSNWLARWPADGEALPTPEPDAFVGVRPLWLESSFPKWEAWRRRHREEAPLMRAHRAKQPTLKEIQEARVGASEAEAAANRKALVAALSDWRRAAGNPSIHALAKASGLSHQTVTNIFKGGRSPQRRTVVALTEHLGGDMELALRLWEGTLTARKIPGAWLSRVLSNEHAEVLRMAAAGGDVEQIAAACRWTVEGVQSYCDEITERLRVDSMGEAVQVAVEVGYLLIDDDGTVSRFVKRGAPDTRGGADGYLANQVARRLRERFAQEAPGTALPTLNQLAVDFGVSTTTVSVALRLLRAEGFLGGGGKGRPFTIA